MTPDWRAARALVMRYGWNSAAYQILNPGMGLWFSRARDAVAGYASYGGVRVIAGAPVSAPERLNGVADELEADSNDAGDRLAFFGAGARLERAYAERHDHSTVVLGAEPVWDPRAWSSIVERKASLRAQLNRARNKGVRVVEWPADRARAAGPLREVLRDWLGTRGLPPLGFMATPDLLDRVDDRLVFVAEQPAKGRIVGFLVATPIPARSGWLVEEWPRIGDAPNGTTHLLVDTAMRRFAEGGSTYATLGLAPLSRRGEDRERPQPAWLRLALAWVQAHGRRFYNFEGLEAFKAGLQPMRWEPVFSISQGRRFTPRLLRAIAGVFGGGSPERLIARAVASAVAQEVRALF